MDETKFFLAFGSAGMYFQLRDGSGSVIAKNFGFGSGIGYIFKKELSIGYFRVLKIMIGCFRVHPNIVQFLYERFINVTDFSHFDKEIYHFIDLKVNFI